MHIVIVVLLAAALVPQAAEAQSLHHIIGAVAAPGYYGGGYGSGYGPGYSSYDYGYYGAGWHRVRQPGVKFDLDLLSKEDRKLVLRGIVFINGNDHGVVNQYDDWTNGILPLEPGPHAIAIVLPDGRRFSTEISVAWGRTTRVYPRFADRTEMSAPIPPAPSTVPAPTTPAPAPVVASPPEPPPATQPQPEPGTAPAPVSRRRAVEPPPGLPRNAGLADIIAAVSGDK